MLPVSINIVKRFISAAAYHNEDACIQNALQAAVLRGLVLGETCGCRDQKDKYEG